MSPAPVADFVLWEAFTWGRPPMSEDRRCGKCQFFVTLSSGADFVSIPTVSRVLVGRCPIDISTS